LRSVRRFIVASQRQPVFYAALPQGLEPVNRVPVVNLGIQTVLEVSGVREVLIHHAFGGVTQLGLTHLVVGQVHQVQRAFSNRHALEVRNHGLRTVHSSHVSATLVVV